MGTLINDLKTLLWSIYPILKYLLSIFSGKFSNLFLSKKGIIYIDESSYPVLSKIATHCCQKENLNLLLILFEDESLIHKILIEVFRSTSTKSIDFCEFLLVIQKYLALRLPQRITDVAIIMNNVRIHITWRA